jgi:hypothetical protein
MMLWLTVVAEKTLKDYGKVWICGLQNVVWNFIRSKHVLSTARMMTGEETILKQPLIFLDTRFAQGDQRIKTESSL